MPRDLEEHSGKEKGSRRRDQGPDDAIESRTEIIMWQLDDSSRGKSRELRWWRQWRRHVLLEAELVVRVKSLHDGRWLMAQKAKVFTSRVLKNVKSIR